MVALVGWPAEALGTFQLLEWIFQWETWGFDKTQWTE